VQRNFSRRITQRTRTNIRIETTTGPSKQSCPSTAIVVPTFNDRSTFFVEIRRTSMGTAPPWITTRVCCDVPDAMLANAQQASALTHNRTVSGLRSSTDDRLMRKQNKHFSMLSWQQMSTSAFKLERFSYLKIRSGFPLQEFYEPRHDSQFDNLIDPRIRF
jgi:hypothetical protein